MALYPSGLRGRSAKPLFVGSNPTGASTFHNISMFTVYILLSQKDNKRYIGFTHDLQRRIREHNSGKVTSTKYRRPFKLIFSESFQTKSEAIKREREIKNKKGKFIIP